MISRSIYSEAHRLPFLIRAMARLEDVVASERRAQGELKTRYTDDSLEMSCQAESAYVPENDLSQSHDKATG
jgi:hypothetical protein